MELTGLRLHDELISVAAQWLEGKGKGHLKPFAEEADRRAIEQLENTLAEAPALETIDAKVQARLLATAPEDFSALWSSIEKQAGEKEKAIRKLLLYCTVAVIFGGVTAGLPENGGLRALEWLTIAASLFILAIAINYVAKAVEERGRKNQ